MMELLITECLLLCVISSCGAISCGAYYTVQSICDSGLGSTLATYSHVKSRADCARICSLNSLCLSTVFDSGNETCKTFAEFQVIVPCPTTVFYISVKEVRQMSRDM